MIDSCWGFHVSHLRNPFRSGFPRCAGLYPGEYRPDDTELALR